LEAEPAAWQGAEPLEAAAGGCFVRASYGRNRKSQPQAQGLRADSKGVLRLPAGFGAASSYSNSNSAAIG
jgi:hypothetical protein